jgi:DNA-binding winged helix-turn-helix (wHTH) protein
VKEPIPARTKHFYSFGPFRLYAVERELFRRDEPVALPPKAVDTLLVLVRNRGHVVDKDELMKALWPDAFVEEANLGKQISQLRKELGETPDGKPYIETVSRRGYRFAATVTESWEGEQPEVAEGEGPRPVLEQQTQASVASLPRPPAWRKIGALGAVGIVFVLIVAAVLWFRIFRPTANAPGAELSGCPKIRSHSKA